MTDIRSPHALLVQRSAEVLAQTSGDVPSPCVSVCLMHPQSGLCEGCFRNLDEIATWSRMSDEAKRQVWQRIGVRAA